MATIWLHKANGCDFLVSFETKVAAVEFSSKVFPYVMTEEYDEDDISSINKRRRDDALACQVIPTTGMFIGQTPDLQAIILPNGYVPQQKKENGTRYDKIAYAWPDDALAMVSDKKEPAQYYTFPSGFQVLDREEPYNFTKYIPNNYELDEELADYMMIV